MWDIQMTDPATETEGSQTMCVSLITRSVDVYFFYFDSLL